MSVRVLRTIELEALQIFKAVVDFGGVTRAAAHFAEVCALSLKNFSSRSGRDAAPEKREIRETPIPLVCEYLGEQLHSQQTEAWKGCK